MSRAGTWASTNVLRLGSGLVTSHPLTMACWGYSTGFSECIAMNLVNSGSGDYKDQYRLGFLSNAIVAGTGSGSTAAWSSASFTPVTNTWYHLGGVWSSATSRLAYYNGVAGTENTSNLTPSGINRLNIGAQGNTSGLHYPWSNNGAMAEMAVWNAALTAAEMAELAYGVCPLLVRPESLVGYWPLIGNSPENSLVSNTNTLSIVGTMPVSALHPPIMMPKRRQFII